MCILFHKWGKWVEYKNDWKMILILSGKTVDQYEIRQKRVCEKCGKIQDEKVRDM